MPELILPANAYNNCILRYQGRLLMSYRHHDRNGGWRTSLGIAELDKDFCPIKCKAILPPQELIDNSHEDARMWIHQGKLWLSWTISQWPTQEHKCIMAYGKLVEDEQFWRTSVHYIPSYGSNDFTALEKNWVFLPHSNKLYCLYLTHEEQIWLELEGARVEEVHKSKALRWPYAAIHGGAICEGTNGNLVHFFNSHTIHKHRDLDRYLIGAVELEGVPPFAALRISKRPVLVGEEGVCLDRNLRFKSNVVFVAGAMKTGDQEWLLSFGRNDHQCCLVKLGVADLKL